MLSLRVRDEVGTFKLTPPAGIYDEDLRFPLRLGTQLVSKRFDYIFYCQGLFICTYDDVPASVRRSHHKHTADVPAATVDAVSEVYYFLLHFLK